MPSIVRNTTLALGLLLLTTSGATGCQSKPEATAPVASAHSHNSSAAPASPAAAGSDALPALPKLSEMKFELKQDQLWVDSPAGSSSLGIESSGLKGATLKDAEVELAWTHPYRCEAENQQTFSEAYLQARIENTRAFRLYQKSLFAEAARGFARAATLDPEYPLPRSNHIAALARAGDLQAAHAAFAAAFERDPVHTYYKLLSDADFVPLQQKWRRAIPKMLLLSLQGNQLLGPELAHAKSLNLIAALRHEDSWGASNFVDELQVFDARTGKRVEMARLIDWRDGNEDGVLRAERRGAVQARIAQYNETLLALGFTAVNNRCADFAKARPTSSAPEAALPGLQQSLVAGENVLRLVRGNDVVASFTPMEMGVPKRACALPEAGALLYIGHFEVSEGCDSGPESRLQLLPTAALQLE